MSTLIEILDIEPVKNIQGVSLLPLIFDREKTLNLAS